MTENTILLESGTNELEVIEFHLSSSHDSQARMTHYAIKEDPVLQDIVVIMFSSMITDRVTHKCQAVGADGQVSKPDIGRIRETISEHLPE